MNFSVVIGGASMSCNYFLVVPILERIQYPYGSSINTQHDGPWRPSTTRRQEHRGDHTHNDSCTHTTEVSRLKDIFKSLSKSRSSSTHTTHGCSLSPHPQAEPTLCWYHERFEDDARKCWPPVPSWETIRPVTSGDEHWPTIKSPVLCDWQTCWLPLLVNTGANLSVIPPSPAERRHHHERSGLQAVNGTPIATYSSRSLTLGLELRRNISMGVCYRRHPIPDIRSQLSTTLVLQGATVNLEIFVVNGSYKN